MDEFKNQYCSVYKSIKYLNEVAGAWKAQEPCQDINQPAESRSCTPTHNRWTTFDWLFWAVKHKWITWEGTFKTVLGTTSVVLLECNRHDV